MSDLTRHAGKAHWNYDSAQVGAAPIAALIELDELGDVSATGPTAGMGLEWSGSAWRTQLPAFANVKAAPFNGVGDGTPGADATPLASALAAVSAAGGGYVFLPEGDFNIGAATLTKPVNVSIIGTGPYSTFITSTNVAGGHIIDVTGGRSRIEGVRLVGATGGGDGLRLEEFVSRLVVADVNIEFAGGHGVNFVNGDFLVTLINVEATTCVGDGFHFTNGATSHNSITGIECYANDCAGSGWDIRNALAVNLIGCAADNGSGTGFLMASARVQFTGCTAEQNVTQGYAILGSGRYLFRGCRTGAQLLPWNINGAGTTILDECETTSTPSGNSVQVSASGTGQNRLIGGSYDRAISINAAGILIRDGVGTGDPEAAVVGSVGSTWRRTDGGAATALYVKETGVGNTGWVGK
jgi:hypothetical protein